MPGDTGPGTSVLEKGDAVDGFFGLVPSEEMIGGNELASLLSFSSGANIIANNDAGWLKFVLDGKILFTPLCGFRSGILWNHLNTANIVYGSRQVQVNGYIFSVRLPRGVVADPSGLPDSYTNSAFPEESDDETEWGRTIRRCQDGRYASYSTADLGVVSTTYGNWCQESARVIPARFHIVRGGGQGAQGLYVRDDTTTRQWRPFLELIGKV